MRPVPAPGEPEGLILYDGVCVFCSRWVRWVIARDSAGHFRFAPVQGVHGRRMAQALGLDPEAPQSNAVTVDGMALFKSDATLSVLSNLPGWGWTRVFLSIPRSIRDWTYDRMAANRYRFFGRSDVCWLPTPEERERFLD